MYIITPLYGATDNNFCQFEWKLTWSRAAEIGDSQVCKTVTSEGATGAAKRVLFYLPELSDVFLLDILISLSHNLSRQGGGVAKAVTV